MTHHLLAFGNNALDASAGDVQLAAVADNIYNVSGSNYQLFTPHQVLWAYAGGTGLTRARIRTGSLQGRGFPHLFPHNNTAMPPSPRNVLDYRAFPLQLKQDEDLRVEVTNAAANPATVILAVTPFVFNPQINMRDLRVLRFTSSPTGTLQTWAAPAAITFQDVLEGGTYNVYGMAVQGTNVIAGRLIFPDQLHRPGCLGQTNITDIPTQNIMFGGMGKWGSFRIVAQPQLEVFAAAAGAVTIEGRLLCAKAA